MHVTRRLDSWFTERFPSRPIHTAWGAGKNISETMKDETKKKSASQQEIATGQHTDTIIQFLIVVHSTHTVRSLQKQEEPDSALKNSVWNKPDQCFGHCPPSWFLARCSVSKKNGSVTFFRWKRWRRIQWPRRTDAGVEALGKIKTQNGGQCPRQ
jgi:hypothetical protein